MVYSYPKLKEARVKALTYGLNPDLLKSSTKYPYKLEYIHDGKIIRFGHRQFQDYLVHGDNIRRAHYIKRHGAILNANDRPAYMVRYSPAWFSYHVLWN